MPYTYKVDDKVICKQTPDVPFGYVAKVIDIQMEDGIKTYTVHYNGWNSRYDEMVKEDELEARVIPWSQESEKEHKRLMKEAKDKLGKKRKIGGEDEFKKGKDKAGDDGSSVTSTDTRVTHIKKPLDVHIPEKLRAILIDDSDHINRQHRLAKLPARCTIDKIIQDYCQAVAGSPTGNASGNDELLVETGSHADTYVYNKCELEESSLGVRDYFNAIIGPQLLYGVEKAQFGKFCREGVKDVGDRVNQDETPELENLKIIPSSVYGLTHLLRLFIKMGPLLAQTMKSDRSINLVLKHIHDLLVWLSKNVNKYYLQEEDYEAAG